MRASRQQIPIIVTTGYDAQQASEAEPILESGTRPRYTLAEMLAASDFSQPLSDEDREWLDAPAVGRELL